MNAVRGLARWVRVGGMWICMGLEVGFEEVVMMLGEVIGKDDQAIFRDSGVKARFLSDGDWREEKW